MWSAPYSSNIFLEVAWVYYQWIVLQISSLWYYWLSKEEDAQSTDHPCVFDHFLLLIIDVNFGLKNDIFWIWVQLMKWILSSAISSPIGNFKKYVNFNIL